MAAFPGMGATILTLGALRANARSSERPATLLIFMPGAGLYSYMVMTGPGRISTTSPSTPKSTSFLSRRRAFISRLSRWISMSLSPGNSLRRSKEGSLNSPTTFMKEKDSCSGCPKGSVCGSTMVNFGLTFSCLMISFLTLFFRLFSLFFMKNSLIRLMILPNHKVILEKTQPNEMWVQTIREMMNIAARST